MTSCSIAICTKGRRELIEPTLRAAAVAAASAGDTEILVVEQGGDSAADLARQLDAGYLRDVGVGVSRARNLALASAGGEVVLYTDDDCIVPESWVVGHRAVLDAHPEVAGSFGAVDGLPRDPDPDAAAVVAIRGPGAAPWDIGHGSNAAVRRQALLAVGGFDERIGPGSHGVPAGEDADLIARLVGAGCQLAAGTGQPVSHVHWRTADENAAILKTYEAGAGVCVGAALRARRPFARRHLYQRLLMLRHRGGARLAAGHPGDAAALGLAFASGLAHGLRLPPWHPG